MTSTNDGAGTHGSRRTNRWLWTGLVVSLAVNLLVVGFMIGAAWHRGGHRGGDHRHSFKAFMRQLPDSRRAQLQQRLREKRESLKTYRQQLRQTNTEWERTLVADPFNLEAFTSANQKVHESRAAFGGKRAEIVPALVATMTAEERQKFLNWHKQRRRRWRGRR
ncbi:MAG: periplasmic heavy metal sensor [Hyphomicrobiaceae bacterium]